jgi:hypothetical protein
LKFNFDSLDLEAKTDRNLQEILFTWYGRKQSRKRLLVNIQSLELAQEKISSGNIPTSLKFGTMFRGIKVNFRKAEGAYYSGSIVFWFIPLVISWKAMQCFEKKQIKALLEYYLVKNSRP